MFWLATLAALAADAPETGTSASPERQAQAVVQILRAARVQLGEGSAGGDQDAAVRETSIRDQDGQLQPAVLVEFS